MTEEDSLILPEARAMLGSESVVDIGEVTLREIQRYAMATMDDNPLYFDPGWAKQTAYEGIVAPPNMLSACMWGIGAPEEQLRPDGIAAGGARVPLKVTAAMGGGQELKFEAPVRPGDRFTRTDKLVDLYERDSRMGRLVFSVTEQVYRNQRGEIAVTCLATSIFHG